MQYIFKRKNNYYFRYRLTKSLSLYFPQSDYFTKSLQSENALKARKNAKILLNKLNYIQQSIKMNITDNEIIKLVNDLTNTIFLKTEHDLYNTNRIEDTVFAFTLEDRIADFKNAYNEEDYTLVREEALSIFKTLNLSYNENDFSEVCKKLLENHINNLKIIDNKIDNFEYYKPRNFETVKPEEKVVVVKKEEILTIENSYNMFENYFIEKDGWTDDTKSANRKYFSFLNAFVKKNRDIKTIKIVEFDTYISKLSQIKVSVKSDDFLSKRTMNKYITLTNKFFKYLFAKDLIEKPLYIDKIKMSGKDMLISKKETFSDEELKKWYEYALNLAAVEDKWIIFLAMYNGFSISEIVRMEKHNFFEEDNLMIAEVEFTLEKDTKNVHRIRKVPLHLKLVELGFLEFVKSKGNGNLFDTDNKKFSRRMTDINRKYVTTNKKKTFYRLRANFIDKLLQSGVQNSHVSALVGHSQEYSIAFNSYANKLNPSLLADALQKIDYQF